MEIAEALQVYTGLKPGAAATILAPPQQQREGEKAQEE
jgi:membrane-associated progesterone receptor component